MAYSRPSPIRPWAQSGTLVTPSDSAMNQGLLSTFRYLGFGTFNFLMGWAMNAAGYTSRTGIADWSSTETYVTNDIQRVSGVLYQCIGTPTVGLSPATDTANWVPLLAPLPMQFGDASDGNVTINTSQTLTLVEKQYNNLTIGASGNVHVVSSIIRVRGTLTMSSGGLIQADGQSASGLTDGVGDDAALSAYSGAGVYNGPLHGGGMGGIRGGGRSDYAGMSTLGNTFAGSAPSAAADGFGTSMRVNGGGSSSGGAGGSSGDAGGLAGTTYAPNNAITAQYNMPGFYFGRRIFNNTEATDDPTHPLLYMLHGGGGGGAGGTGVGGNTNCGGGGAGGGQVFIFANRVVVATANQMRALGGNGGNATGGSGVRGGGGGGGGGRVIVFYRSWSGAALTSSCVLGGNGGTGLGGGALGNNGGVGIFAAVQV